MSFKASYEWDISFNWVIQLFVQKLILDNNKETSDGMRYQPFVLGIHQLLVDSLHKGPVMWAVLPCHDFMNCM